MSTNASVPGIWVPDMEQLWYTAPARHWEEALPLGNGRIGAMVYGGISRERIELNEDTLWTGGPAATKSYDIPGNIGAVRDLLRQKDYTEACRRTSAMMARHDVQAYQLAGNLYMDFSIDDACSNYRRDLDLTTAIATTKFHRADAHFIRETLVSVPHQVVAMRCAADHGGEISFILSADSHMRHKVSSDGPCLVLTGACPRRNGTMRIPPVWEEDGRTGVPYVLKTRVLIKGGTITAEDGSTKITGADEAIILVAIQTGFTSWQQEPADDLAALEATCDHQLDVAAAAGWETLKAQHCRDYDGYYSRMRLDLGEKDDRPTDELLKGHFGTGGEALVNLVFNYGRYLLISCSRPGTQPANLQGIWNDKPIPDWRSDYHTNINLQMNYWPAETCNLSECAGPLLDYIRDIAESGRYAAQMVYGARGWCMHPCSDIWRYSHTAGACPNFSLWPLGGAWLCQHVWEHFAFSRDIDFLQSAMPILREAALFFVDFLVDDGNGRLTTSPSCSPENAFIDPTTGESVGLCEGSAMDLTIIRELFGAVLEGNELLREQDGESAEIANALNRLAKPTIGKDRRMLEYGIEAREPEPTHRHLSHIYGVYPGWMFTPEKNADYYEACRKSLDARGDKSTGWAMGWRVALWARFRDGNRALSVIGNLLNYIDADAEVVHQSGGGLYANLWDSHPPFQIDGNFGVTAGIAEMLVQSHTAIIDLLPALPDAWRNGSVTGLRTRGGYEVDMVWKDGKLAKAVVRGIANSSDPCVIRYGGHSVVLGLRKGEEHALDTANLVSEDVNS